MNGYLIADAMLSGAAALLHVGCIVFGAPWYRLFGAGEQMAQLAERGSAYPTMITSGIVLVLCSWVAYALSGAGVLPRLPLLKLALVIITGIYLLRGTVGFAGVWVSLGGNSPAFWVWSSLICLTIGVVHLVGLLQLWPGLDA